MVRGIKFISFFSNFFLFLFYLYFLLKVKIQMSLPTHINPKVNFPKPPSDEEKKTINKPNIPKDGRVLI